MLWRLAGGCPATFYNEKKWFQREVVWAVCVGFISIIFWCYMSTGSSTVLVLIWTQSQSYPHVDCIAP